MRTSRSVVVGLRSVAACAVLGAALVALPSAAGAAPPPAAGCQNQGQQEPAEPITETPWPQRRLAPERVWPFSQGNGVLVAVIDSGVDVTHPQLGEKVVQPGLDLLGRGDGRIDCISHGTGVASIIAAQPMEDVGFRGLAPKAKILPIRVSDKEEDDKGNITGQGVGAAQFAQSIQTAADRGAKVINLSVVGQDNPAIQQAVRYALSKDVVIVAAVGNGHQEDQPGAEPKPYPAAYDGVIGVGAIAEDGDRVTESQIGDYVDLVAPGGKVVAAASGSPGHEQVDGTSFATPFVAATAALVRAAYPKLSAEEVTKRLLATAGPSRGGTGSQEYGHGEVDPYRAVTEQLAGQEPVKPQLEEPVEDPEAAAQERQRAWSAQAAVIGAGAALLAVVVVMSLAAVIPRGRRRAWRPGQRPPPKKDKPRDDEEDPGGSTDGIHVDGDFFAVSGLPGPEDRSRTGP